MLKGHVSSPGFFDIVTRLVLIPVLYHVPYHFIIRKRLSSAVEDGDQMGLGALGWPFQWETGETVAERQESPFSSPNAMHVPVWLFLHIWRGRKKAEAETGAYVSYPVLTDVSARPS